MLRRETVACVIDARYQSRVGRFFDRKHDSAVHERCIEGDIFGIQDGLLSTINLSVRHVARVVNG